MVSSTPTVIDGFLIDYTQAINSGFGFIEGDVQFLASVMIAISLVMAGLFWALKGEDVMVPFLRKILFIGFFAFLMNNWTFLMGVIISSFVELGIKAGGSTMSADVFFSPAAIASLGMNYWQNFAQSIDNMTGPVAFFENIVPILVLFLTGLIVIAAFFVMALQVFVTIVMFKLVTLAAFVLVPFGLLKHTNFMSERALGLVVSYGLKFLTLSLIISIGYSVFSKLQPSVPMSLGEAFSLCLAALALMMLALHAPAVASELITGGPQLGAGAMGASIAGGVALGAGATYLAARATSGAGQMAANPLIRAAGAGNILVNGQPMSSANSPSSLNSYAGAPSSSTPTFHSQSGQGQEKKDGASQSSRLGKGTIAGGAATSSMARHDSSGGISSTHSNHQDEGE